MSKRSKKLGAFCCATVLLMSLSVPAFASSIGWSGPCERFRSGTDLASAKHVTNNNQASVKLNTMGGGYTRMYFLIRKNGHDVTDTTTCSKHYSTNLPYIRSVSHNDILHLIGGNDKWTPFKVDCTGEVDFH